REIEFLLYQGKDSDLKDSIDQTDLANLDAYFVDPIPKMFNDEHALDYSFPPRFDVYDDDFLEIEVDDLPSPDNEDKVFNPGILIQEKLITIITRVAQEKKLTTSYASLVFENFDPPFYEPLVFKDVPKSMRLPSFSSKNEEKVFKPGIYTSEKNRANLADIFVDSILEMFTDEHALDYSSPLIFDEYDDDFLEVQSDAGNVYDDPFDSHGEKIKESKLLIDELNLLYDFLPPSEYDSFISQDFTRLMLYPQPTTRTRYLTQPPLGCSLSPLLPLLISSSMGELGQAQRPKTSASWEKLVFPLLLVLFVLLLWFFMSSIPGNVKTLAKGFYTPVFISSASNRESCIQI
nr:hypothetical protein [Tanacetum cinerariifolium]